MEGLKYQLKNIRRDKMCILTFLLPVIAGIAISLLSGVDFHAISETSFGILKNDLSDEAAAWLRSNGHVTQYETIDALQNAVNDPSTQTIGVLKADPGIRTLRSGDELEADQVIADTLPQVYDSRMKESRSDQTIIPASNENEGLKSLLVVITLVTALSMGCTFNAMNIISEKEDGVAFINRILPMTAKTYMIQKMLLGLIGGTLSSVLTALICIRIGPAQVFPLFLIVVLSAFIAALMGLYIGHFSEGLMIGIVYTKALMILFLAPPVFFYLMVPAGSVLFHLSYLLPSSAAFYGLMKLADGSAAAAFKEIPVLAVHCTVWFLLYLPISKYRKGSL